VGIRKTTVSCLTRHISESCEIEGWLQWTAYKKPYIVSPMVT